jgi:hypothetical protein
MQIKDVIKAIAPIAGSLIGSPVAGMAISAIGEAIGMKQPTASASLRRSRAGASRRSRSSPCVALTPP